MNSAYLAVLRMLLSQPTAPFQEDRVIEAIRQWAAKLGLPFGTDPAGNVVVRYRRGGGKLPKWVFAAHMDHPGFISLSRRGRTLVARFRGGVQKPYFKGSRVRFFAPAGEAAGTVTSIRKFGKTVWWDCRIRLDSATDVPRGTVGMWDLPPLVVRGNKIVSRACDDVVGTASVLCAMEEIVRRRPNADVTALLTRAEEAGFVGAMAACKARTLHKDSLIVAIETSKAQPSAQLGDGVVIRVGDRTAIFDPSLTGHLTAAARSLAKTDRNFKYARQLMPGGTCESTAYMVYGYRATGLCLPLANYHNMGPKNRIAAEEVHAGDFESLVKLLAHLAVEKSTPADSDRALRNLLADLLKSREKYLRRPI